MNNIREFELSYYAHRLQGGATTPVNYIELRMKFETYQVTNIKYLVFEFYTKDEDLRSLYSNLELFPGLKSGDEFPCSVPTTGSAGIYTNGSTRLICNYYNGEYDGLGSPHKVIVTNFLLNAGVDGTIKFLVNNPNNPSVSFRIGLKAYGGNSL